MIYIITPTDDRPEAFSFLERWLGAQDWPGAFRWVVGTRDSTPYTFALNQIVVDRPDAKGLHPLASNLLACLDVLDMRPNDLAIICEDDDYYDPNFISRIAELSGDVALCGQTHSRYYNVATRRYRENGNSIHASLCQTAFRSPVLSLLREVCLRGLPTIDKALWREWSGSRRLARSEGHIGIKGMPGAKGIGTGHRLNFGKPDSDGSVFREWGIPGDYERFAWSRAKAEG